MKIRILGWNCENIRQFRNLEFHLEDEAGLPHIYLVMMRNGTGKTTTMNLIRTVLSGSDMTEQEVRSYRPTEYDCEEGKFTLIMQYDDKRYFYVLKLDYLDGKFQYFTSRTGECGGLESGRMVPRELKVFDNRDFICRFVFDGEQAQLTLDSGTEEAEKAITYLYRVNELDNLIGDINKLIDEKQKETNDKGKSTISIRQLRTRRDNKSSNHESLLKRKEILQKEKKRLQAQKSELERQQAELIAENENLQSEKDKLEHDKDEINNAMKTCFTKIHAQIVLPFHIHDKFESRLKTLFNNMQSLKLPKTTAKEFFLDLSEKPKCICGHDIGEEEKENILKNADRYLGAEELSVIYSVKNKLRTFETSNELYDELEKLQNLKEDLIWMNGQIEDLNTKLEPEKQEVAQQILMDLEKVNSELNDVQQELSVLLSPASGVYAREENNLELAQKAMAAAQKAYDEATNTYQYAQRSRRMIRYIQQIKTLTLEKLKKNILEDVNIRLAQLIKNDKVSIDRIDKSLILHKKEKVSEAQTLAVAYAYIGSLFEHSVHDFPFLIDSPAAKMDRDIRRTAAEVLPELFDQLIILVTSGELDKFADRFYNRNDVKYVTIENDEVRGTTCNFDKGFFASYQEDEVANYGI